jgi:hypothetical protein
MLKNPIVANIQATNIRIKPMPNMIVNHAPIHIKVPAVVNDASPDFSASVLKTFRRCHVARM